MVISFFFLKQMMGGDNAHFMEGYMTALETMNKEAVEYIRGIPVVKVFQQTVYSFKNFHTAIEEYEKYASGYALKCRIPLTGFNVSLNGTFILLIPVACMILSGLTGQAAYQDVLLAFLFYSLFTPVCTTMMSRVMFASEQLMAAKSAVTRIEGVLKEEPLAEAEHPQQPRDASVSFENVSFSYPGASEVALLACVLNAFLAPLLGQEQGNVSAALYTVVGIVILALIFILHYRQYTVTYMGTYEESERRRITLAEKLRTLPLRFFHGAAFSAFCG